MMTSRNTRRTLLSLVSMCCAMVVALPCAEANPDGYGLGSGRNGTFTATSARQTINTYTAVTEPAAMGTSSVTVSSTAGLAVGDLVLVWQTQGGSFTSGATGTLALGAGTVGNYELDRISAITGTTLTLQVPLTGTYAATGAQVIRVPEYTSVTVPPGRSLSAPAWNGTIGSIVVFLATGEVNLAGGITVDGLGARGGEVSNNHCAASCACAASDDSFLIDDPSCNQGRRGESIDRSAGAYGTTACGVGNRANGGGGGGHINAGGAGGGHGGMGGRGGDAWCTTPGQPTGGRSGQALSGSLIDRLTFGGGGGGGQQNNVLASPGGAGGGVVFFRALSLTGTGAITANGANGPNPGNDGGGGGGAGGAVLIRLAGAATCGSIQANGGAGATVSGHGNGGGGGGGRVGFDAASVTGCAISINGGAAGTGWTGATAGAVGVVIPNAGSFGCASSAACTGATPFCDPTTRACRGCVSDGECPTARPVCAATGACVQCSATNTVACTGATRVCDTTTSACVGCLRNNDCPVSMPVCDGATRTCRPCTADTQCSSRAATPACNTTSGACVECTATNRTACTGTPPLCDTERNVCAACLSNADCEPSLPVCSTSTRTCAACTADAQCAGRASTPACNTTSGACVPCTAANTGACTGATRLCDVPRNTCVGCRSSADCSAMTPTCDATSRSCRACAADADCGGATPACQRSGACAQCSMSNTSACTGVTPVCNVSAGSCVGCVSNANCRDGTPICDVESRQCRGCTRDSECSGATPACDTSSGACVQCTTTNAMACMGATPVCGSRNTCVLCTAGASGMAIACAMSADGRACVQPDPAMPAFCGCASDADCGDAMSGRVCDNGTRRCIEGCVPAPMRNGCPAGRFCTSNDPMRVGVCTSSCVFDRDCVATTPSRPRCLGGRGDAGAPDGSTSVCVECVAMRDCAARTDNRVTCDPASNTCVQCTAASREMCTASGVGSQCLPSGLCGCTGDSDCAADRSCDPATSRCAPRPMTDGGVDAGADVAAITDVMLPMDVSVDATPPTVTYVGDGCGCGVLGGDRRNAGAGALLAALATLLRRRRMRRRA